MSVVGLIHGYRWDCSFDEISLAHGISICRLKETPIEVCYHRLCEVKDVDDREPYQYEVFVRLKDQTEYILDFLDPLSLLNRVCNMIVVIAGGPIGMCRVLFSRNDFASLPDTELAFTLVGQTEFLEHDWPSITPALANDLVAAWPIVQELWERDKSKGRVANALLFFYSAWRSHYIEHICLNLAICLEILFAPHSSGETTHQIAFNVSRFLTAEPTQRELIFAQCKRFYGVRSAIVHGGIPDETRIIDNTVTMFPLVASILKKIVVQKALAQTFNEEQGRDALLRQYLFS